MRSRPSARERASPATRAHSTYQGTRTSAEPNTTARGSSASPTKSCTTEIDGGRGDRRAEAASTAWRRVRGSSGIPNPYAATASATTKPSDQAKRDEAVNE